jgi:quercetin dioxygenase-like cupin family protein
MLKFEKIHMDERGEIYVITGALPEGREITLFTTKKGYARGGCVHRENRERVTMINGGVRYHIEHLSPKEYWEGDLFTIPAGVAHYFISLTDSVVIEWGATIEEKKEYNPEWRKIVEKINNGVQDS